MTKASAVSAAIALLCLGGFAQADVFNLGPGLTNLETVLVGDAGNVGELSGTGAGGIGPDRICGSVNYDYRIGKFEVTAGQYCDFLNHKATSDPYGLYNTAMSVSLGCEIDRSGTSGSYTYSVASDLANRPVNYVSFWDACRFVNWLENGQGEGDTETGAYTLNGYYNGSGGGAITRNPGATWRLPSEDEWHKAAYYKAGGTNAGYWEYPNRSDSVPSNDLIDPDPGNNANFYLDGYTIGGPYVRTEVGEFENSRSAYGTFDQGGNVMEWNETIVEQDGTHASRGYRGGAFGFQSDFLRASTRREDVPTLELNSLGFRVAAVPEPPSIVALAGGLCMLVGLRRRWISRKCVSPAT